MEKTLGRTFCVKHIAGILNLANIAMSRYPCFEKPIIPGDVNSIVVASLDQDMMVAGWEDVKDATIKDPGGKLW